MSVNFYTGANQVIVKNTLTDDLKTSYDDAVELVNKLGGDATVDGSVAQRIAAIVANAPEKYDTLKEIATWIESDTDGAAKMQADISTLEADKLDKTSVSSWAKASTKPEYTASEINMADGTSVESAIGTLNSNTLNIRSDLLSNYAIGLTMSFEQLSSMDIPTFFTNWHDADNFPGVYGGGILIPTLDGNVKYVIYVLGNDTYTRRKGKNGWSDWTQLTPAEGTITLNTTSNDATILENSCKKLGNMVIFTISCSNRYTFTGGTWNENIAIFPEGFRPSATKRFNALIYREGNVSGDFEINSDGTCRLFAEADSSDQALYVSGMFSIQ